MNPLGMFGSIFKKPNRDEELERRNIKRLKRKTYEGVRPWKYTNTLPYTVHRKATQGVLPCSE